LVTEINKSLEANFLNEDIEIIAEPGCYCVLSAVSLVTSIIGKKTLLQNENYAERREYYLNDGFYGSFPYFFKAYDAKYIPVLHYFTTPIDISEIEKSIVELLQDETSKVEREILD
ncbi:ornithine decarboxylase, partial [Nephila pilipes]